MDVTKLYHSVRSFAIATHTLPEYILNNGGWSYDAYGGVRYALLHTTLELRRLAARLHGERIRRGLPQTQAQYALGQHHAAFRDFESLLVGMDQATYVSTPKPEEWCVNLILVHVHEVERFFLAAILNTVRNPKPRRLSDEEVAALVDEPVEMAWEAPLEEAWTNYALLHGRLQHALADLSDEQLGLPSPAWEPEPWPVVEFRLHRFEAHLREHTNQLEKTLAWLGCQRAESMALVRQLYAALAEVEGLCIGAGDLDSRAIEEQAEKIDERLASLQTALGDIDAMVKALKELDSARIDELLQRVPKLARTQLEDGQPAILYAKFHGRDDIVARLLASGLRLTMHESAAVGELERVKKIADFIPEAVNEYGRDGFTPLQLACFFGYEEIARFLLERGADVLAVAANTMQIQPIHAAVAGRHASIVQLLIEHGADVNARQQRGYTPFMAARQNGDVEIEAMLVAAGARPEDGIP
ncbi:MAG: ankyrin repeat domain-containing protein [Caldilineaceae bacterium]|nr:ankyrin repeat domain-containing protein [Caldilineaceae bacterium]